MSNFRLIARELLARGAAREVQDPVALGVACEELLRDETQRAALAAAAGKWREENAGALGKTLAVIGTEISRLK